VDLNHFDLVPEMALPSGLSQPEENYYKIFRYFEEG
jgi:hypothetical protein